MRTSSTDRSGRKRRNPAATHSACRNASGLPRVPTRMVAFFSVIVVEAEQATGGASRIRRPGAGHPLQPGDRLVEELVDDRFGHRLDRLSLIVAEMLAERRTYGPARAGRCAPPCRAARRSSAPRRGSRTSARTIRPPTTISSARCASRAALSAVLADHALEVVDVVEVDVAQIVDARVEIARHAEVDQKRRPVLRASQMRPGRRLP